MIIHLNASTHCTMSMDWCPSRQGREDSQGPAPAGAPHAGRYGSGPAGPGLRCPIALLQSGSCFCPVHPAGRSQPTWSPGVGWGPDGQLCVQDPACCWKCAFTQGDWAHAGKHTGQQKAGFSPLKARTTSIERMKSEKHPAVLEQNWRWWYKLMVWDGWWTEEKERGREEGRLAVQMWHLG